MDALDVAKVCLKRWYIFLLVLEIAFFASLTLSRDREPVYSGTGNFAVIYRAPLDLKPRDVDPREANPMAAGGGSLLKQSIVNDLSSAQSQALLAPKGVSGTGPSEPSDGSRFAVTSAKDSATVNVVAFGTEQAAVRDTINRVMAAAATRAKVIQDSVGAPAAGRLTTFVTLPTQTTKLPPPSAVKLIVGMLAVGAIAGAGLSLLFDRLMTKRAAARGASRGRRFMRRRPRRAALPRPSAPIPADGPPALSPSREPAGARSREALASTGAGTFEQQVSD